MGKFKFDVAIGNPPYQDDMEGDSNTKTPVYDKFMEAVFGVAGKVELITPARFLFNAGYTPKPWNKKMLNDEHFKVFHYEPNAEKIFPNTDIKGGVAVTYRDADKNFGAIGTFSKYQELNTIMRKVTSADGFKSIMEIVVTSFAYHYTKLLYDEHPELNGRSSAGHDFDLQSNTFDTFPEIYSDEAETGTDCIRILGRANGKRCWKYIKRAYVTDVSNLDAYKLFLPKATGKGEFGETLPASIFGSPADGATVTFLSIGNFSTKAEVENCAKYIRTKFARTLLGILKITQDNTPSKWEKVPMQDFTSSSNIDWSQPIRSIDQQLYKKYGLDEKEIAFIEKNVKEMA